MQKANYYRLLWFTLAVLVAGYLLIHLFAMPAFTLGPRSPHDVRLNLCVWEP